MPTDLPLPDLDKLHAEATPGEWVQSSYALEVQRNDGAVADVGEFDRTHDARWTAAAHNTWPTISARLKEQHESILELQERVSGLEEERGERIAREKLLTETLRGVIQEKQTALESCFPSSRHELRKQIAWLESVLGGGK